MSKIKPVLFDILYIEDGLSTLLRERLTAEDAAAELRKIASQHLHDEMPTPFMIPSDVPLCDDITPEYDEDWRQVDIDEEYHRRSDCIRLAKKAAEKLAKEALSRQAPKLVS